MKKRDLLDLLGNIDDELIEDSEKKKSHGGVWIKWAAVAACLCITTVLALGIKEPFIRIAPEETPSTPTPTAPEESEYIAPGTPPEGEAPPSEPTPPLEPAGTETAPTPPVNPETENPNVEVEPGGPVETVYDPNRLPSIPIVQSGHTLGEKTEISMGDSSMGHGMAEIAAPGFSIQTVVEAEIVEVSSDEYYRVGDGRKYRIAVLRIKDTIVGEGLPPEIILRFTNYGADVFENYDSFIFSLTQVGTLDYMMVNAETNTAMFFPDMFDVPYSDLGYGSVLAFKDGVVREEFTCSLNAVCSLNKEYLFTENGENNRYPARIGSTIDEVKQNIIALSKDDTYTDKRVDRADYIDPEKLFESEKARELCELVSRDSYGNLFNQTLYAYVGRTVVSYDRIINGFMTNERIVLTVYGDGSATVEHVGDIFSESDLKKLPDLSEVMGSIVENTPAPPHIDANGMSFKHLSVIGKYRKVDGEVWGVVRLRWQYKESGYGAESGIMDDDMYYLYDSRGNGRIVERDELREVIGDDIMILDFEYGELYMVAT